MSEGKRGRPAPALSFDALQAELALCLEIAAGIDLVPAPVPVPLQQEQDTPSSVAPAVVAVDGMDELRDEISDCEIMLEKLATNLRGKRESHLPEKRESDKLHQQQQQQVWNPLPAEAASAVSAPLPMPSGGEHVAQGPSDVVPEHEHAHWGGKDGEF
jgi:hypothetical protein